MSRPDQTPSGPPDGARESVPLPRPVLLFWVLNIVLGLLCESIMKYWQHVLHREYPYNSAFIPFLKWYDFNVYRPRFLHFHSPEFFSNANPNAVVYEYPAPVALIYKAFYLLGAHSQRIFLLSTGAVVVLLAALLAWKMTQKGLRVVVAAALVGSALLFSYPFWFEYRLGNMEICIFILVAAAILSYLRGSTFGAAILIGIATSMKIFPAVYFALFLARRQYREMAVGVFTAIALNVAALWAVCPDLKIAYQGIAAGLAVNRSHYMLTYLPVETGFDHSLFGLMKRVIFAHRGELVPPRVLSIYLIVAAVSGLALYALRIRHLPVLNQILCLCTLSILLPPTSHDYTLVHLYVPWGLLILSMLDLKRDRVDSPRLYAIFICFAVLASPESEAIHRGGGFSGQIKCMALVLLLGLALYDVLPARTTAGLQTAS